MKEHSERDRRIAEFIESSLSLGSRVLVHHHEPLNTLMGMIYSGGFGFDPLKIIFDERVEIAVTSPYGLPLLVDKGLEKEVSQEILDQLKSFFTSHEEIQRKMDGVINHFFLGGVLENCMVGAVNYFREHNSGQNLYCVKSLCVLDPSQSLSPPNIPMITPEEAVEIIESFEEAA